MWARLEEAYGPRHAARRFAKLLGALDVHGASTIVPVVLRALATETPLVLPDLTPAPVPTLAVPAALQAIDVPSGCAADYADGASATQLHTLARGEWVTAPENLILAGPIGTGKTHLAIALGVEATKQKRRVLFARAADLVRQLLEARDHRELTRLQSRLLRVDVLIIDELGFVPFERADDEKLTTALLDRLAHHATVITTKGKSYRMRKRRAPNAGSPP